MSSDEHELPDLLSASASKVLRALARVLLRNGVACGTVEQLVRKAYVDEAQALAGETGAKATVTSLAAQTGLSRKEVKRLMGPAEDSAPRSEKYNRAVRVLNGWLNDRTYSTAEGVALPLSLQADEAGSFAQLVKDYSGDMTPKAMLDLLQGSECVQVRQDQVHLVRHAYVPANDSKEIVRILGTDTAELIRTIDHNLTCEPKDTRFQRKVSTSLLPTRAVQSFRELVRRRSQALLEDLVTWLNEHEATDDEDAHTVSVGIYHHEHTSPEEPS